MIIILSILASLLGVSTSWLAYLYIRERGRAKKFDSIKNLKHDISVFGEQKIQIGKLINSLKLEISSASTLLDELKSSKSQVENQLFSLKSELNQSQASLNSLTFLNNEEQHKILNLQQQTQNAQQKLSKLSQEVARFQSEKVIAEKEFKISKADLTQLQISVSEVKQEKENFETEISNLSRLISEKKNSIICARSEIEIVKPDTNEVPRGEIKYIGYEPNSIYRQNTPTNYPFVSMPSAKSVIKFPRKITDGRIGIRGYKEADFDFYIKKYFSESDSLKFFNDRFLFITNKTKPYVPDHVLTDEKNNLNLFIDIEIDEPYDGIGRLSTHDKGKDNSRNKYFNERGWLVIRFAEIQVHQNILGCCKHIAKVINSINPSFQIHEDLRNANDIFNVPFWQKLEADKWARENYREIYLGIESFGRREGGNFDTSKLISNEDDEKSEAKVIQTEIQFDKVNLSINIANSHARDKRIKFKKDEHIYFIDDSPNTISGTTFIHKFFPDFDGPKIAPFVARKRGMTSEEVLLQWEMEGKNSADLGTELHLDIEQYFDKKIINDKKEFQHFLRLFEKVENLELYRTEWRIFDDILMLAGTADTIFKKRDGTFVIYDWKRSKEIKQWGHPDYYTNETQKGIGKCKDIEDCNHQHYCLQLNLYKRILEEHYFLEGQVSEMYFVQLHPNFETYNLFEVPNMQDKINEMYNELLSSKY